MTEEIKHVEALFAMHLMQLRKVVFSRFADGSVLRAEARPVDLKSERIFQLTTFMTDGKALHKNYTAGEAPSVFAALACEACRQTNLLAAEGDCEIKRSKKGKLFVGDRIPKGSETVEAASHDHKKHYLIDSREHSGFLLALGVCDENGRVFDKKRAKYRQINRFLELLDDVYGELPAEGRLTVCDLCCGKSYLTFAVYYYLTALKGRSVQMYGVDRKADVMQFCSALSEKLGCEGLTFLAMNIEDFTPPAAIDLVISLHACDIATDIVLAYAIRQKAKVILSTPCCQHELFHSVKAPELDFILHYSILGQKFCDAATDALRALRLEAEGYQTEALELIDPEETPKNVMIRAVRSKKIRPGKREQALEKYRAALTLLGVRPTLDRLLEETADGNG